MQGERLECRQVRAGGARCHQLWVLMSGRASSSCHQEQDILIREAAQRQRADLGFLMNEDLWFNESRPHRFSPAAEGSGRVGTQLSGHSSPGPPSPAGTAPHPQGNGSMEGRGQTQVLPHPKAQSPASPPAPDFLLYLQTTGACCPSRGCQRPPLSVPPAHPSRSGRLRRCPCPERGAAGGSAGRAYGPGPGRESRGVRCHCRGQRDSVQPSGEGHGRRSLGWWHC